MDKLEDLGPPVDTPIPYLTLNCQLCFNCFKGPPEVSLDWCKICTRIKYCSSECSEAGKEQHQHFCKAFAEIRKREFAFLPPLYGPTDPDNIENRRSSHRSQLTLEEGLMGQHYSNTHPLEALDAQLLYHEPRCAVCGDRKEDGEQGRGWRVCEHCKCVNFCSDAHEEIGKNIHSMRVEGSPTQCETMKLSTQMDDLYLQAATRTDDGPRLKPFVAKARNSVPTFPRNWESYISSIFPNKTRPPAPELYGVHIESFSPMMTALDAILSRPNHPNFSGSTLVIHIILPLNEGLSRAQLQLPPCFEEFFHFLPHLCRIELVLISPEMPWMVHTIRPKPLPLCEDCAVEEKVLQIKYVKDTYNNMPEKLEYQLNSKVRPDLVLVLQVSISGESDERLLASLDFLKQIKSSSEEKNPVVCFATRTQEEGMDDIELLEEAGVLRRESGNIQEPECNRWKGGYPHIDGWEEDGCWWSNAFVWTIE